MTRRWTHWHTHERALEVANDRALRTGRRQRVKRVFIRSFHRWPGQWFWRVSEVGG